MTRLAVPSTILRWACERAGSDIEDVAERVPQLPAWVRGEKRPTFKQLEKPARVTHTPFGWFFLSGPPEERLPAPDYRALPGSERRRPSPDLLDTLHAMQLRQAWLSESRREEGEDPLAFVGNASLEDDPAAVGRDMRRALGLDGG